MSKVKRFISWLVNLINIDLKFIKKNLPVITFVTIALFFGSLYIKNIGTLIGPDIHSAHYKASLATATGQIFNKPIKIEFGKRHIIQGESRYFNSGGKSCIGGAFVSIIISDPIKSDGKSDCVKNHDKSLGENRDITDAILQYPFISYIPQAIGLGLGMLVDLEPVYSQTFARALNLLVYIVIISISIYLLPRRGRWTAVALASLPPSLFLASSLSADSLNIAWSFLFISYLVHLYTKGNKISKKQIVVLFVLGVTLFLLKVAYAPLVFLILALRGSVMSSRDNWKLISLITLTGALLYMIWSLNWSSLNAVVDTSDNLKLIITNLPKAIIGIMVNIITIPLMIFDLDSTMYIFLAILTIFLVLNTTKGIKYPKTRRLFDFLYVYRLQVLALTIVFMSMGLTYGALLLTWTDISVYGFMDIQGFQGRYVLPLLPLLLTLTCLPSSRKSKK